LGVGDGGLGFGDWGLGIGPNPQSPIPNPQSPIPIMLINYMNMHLINKNNKINKINIIYENNYIYPPFTPFVTTTKTIEPLLIPAWLRVIEG